MNCKKIAGLIVSAFAVTIMMSGCGDRVPEGFFADGEISEYQIAENVTASAEFPEYENDVEKINLNISNNSDKEFSTGTHFIMQKLEDGEWRYVSVSGNFELLAQIIESNSDTTYTAVLRDHVKYPLPSGQYRIGIELDNNPDEDFTVAYGEFGVK